MNNFPDMTDEQRELEIASVKEMRSHVDFWGHASGFDAEFLMRCADAYLAMLTAKPVKLALRMNKPSAETYGWVAEYPTVPAGIGGITYSFHDNRDDAREEADAYNGHVVEVIRR